MASPLWRRRPSAPYLEEHNAFEEALRILRSNLSVTLLDLERPTVIFTSPNADEGKTSICCNLAMSFALSGQRVVLVDLDLRHPDAHHVVGAHNEFGVSDILLNRRTLEDSIQYIKLPTPPDQAERGLYTLSTGPSVANPTELLSSGRTQQLLEALGKQADLVLVDTPPVLPVADALVVGRIAAGAVLITEARTTSIAAANKAKDLLTRNQTRLLGVVLNKLERRDVSATLGYGYGDDGPTPGARPPGRPPVTNPSPRHRQDR